MYEIMVDWFGRPVKWISGIALNSVRSLKCSTGSQVKMGFRSPEN